MFFHFLILEMIWWIDEFPIFYDEFPICFQWLAACKEKPCLHPTSFKTAQVTWQKMVQKKTPFSTTVFNSLLHGVIRFVASVSSKTTFWLVEILYRPIRSFYLMVFEANTRNKTEHAMWKGMKNCARKWCIFLCTILFEVTWAFCKMWFVIACIPKYFRLSSILSI